MQNQNKMNAVVATGYGGVEVLQTALVPIPKPKPNEILVKVYAAAATRADTMMRTGKPLFARLMLGITKPQNPIPGTGFAGTVAAVGSAVTEFCVGDAVMGETTLGFGAHAEYLVVSENGVVLQKPDNLPFVEASTFCDGHLTAYNFLHNIKPVQPGWRVLVVGASGAMGSAAVQLAYLAGATVTAICSGKNAGWVRGLGAHHTINYQSENLPKNASFDLIFNTVGVGTFAEYQPFLTKNGTYLCPVLSGNLLWQMLRTSLWGTQKAVFQATGIQKEEKLRQMLGKLLALHQAGNLKTVIDRQFPLAKLAEAHQYIDKGHKKGNVVLLTNYNTEY